MSIETFSLILWCWRDLPTNITRIRVIRVDTGEEVYLNDSSFLVRISTDTDASLLRCFIRHFASGREAYVQSNIGLREFVEACLLNKGDASEPSSPDTADA